MCSISHDSFKFIHEPKSLSQNVENRCQIVDVLIWSNAILKGFLQQALRLEVARNKTVTY